MTIRGRTQVLRATFIDAPGGTITDPTNVSLSITKDGAPVLGPLTGASLIKEGTGRYRYDWDIPDDAEPGTYTIAWSALMPGEEVPSVGYEEVEVTVYSTLDVPEYGGCVWPVDPACFHEEWDLLDETVRDRAIALASSSLRRLTGYRVGGCPITVRPAPEKGACFVPYAGAGWPFSPGLSVSGNWLNNCYTCERDNLCGVTLPPPVGRIDAVTVDGEVISPALYRLDNGRELIWMGDGDCPFTATQDMSLPDTEVGTWSVTYLNAYPVDSLGAYAAGVLAMEFALACSGSDQCRLPSEVTAIVRQGISMEIRSGVFSDGMTGIREVDTYIGLWNPRGQQPSTVWSPDQRKFRTSTGGPQ